MTDDRMTLLELVEKDADADLAREMLAFAAGRMMDAEVEVATGAAKGVRTPLRATQRNGYRERDWDTRAGRIELAIPKLRPRRPSGRRAFGKRMIRLLPDHGFLFPELSRAAAHGREGADGRHPRGLRAWCFHPLGG